MAEYATYNLPDHTSGDTMKLKQFAFSAHPSGTLTKVELITNRGNKLSSTESEITITDGANWSFEIAEQVIAWTPGLYKFEIRTWWGAKNRCYIKGNWTIL